MSHGFVRGKLFADPNEEWLSRHDEPIIEPLRRCIDSHHHLWDGSRPRYLMDEFLNDVDSGHNVVATVYVECRSMYRGSGPAEMAAVGEVEFANGIAAMSASGAYGNPRLCDGIVAFADLRLGDNVRTVIDAHRRAAGSRLKGIRHTVGWDPDPNVYPRLSQSPKGLMSDQAFRRGFACLAPMGLMFDAFPLHPQLPELTDLARAFPDTPIVLDHIGGPVGVEAYALNRGEVFRDWLSSMRALAECENVYVKLGGLGMSFSGFDFHARREPPTSDQLAAAWRPYIESSIEAFGPDRSMFESNFPPDKGTCSYRVLWNAFKRIVGSYSDAEKDALFAGTAARFYRLSPELCGTGVPG